MAFHPQSHRLFTYADYCAWPENERWELLDGEPYSMTPVPSRQHQRVVGELFRQLANYLSNGPCEVYVAPFDVRLPEADEDDADVRTVVQPDLVVMCDPARLDDKGCRGAPDLVIEVISPATAARDQIAKLALYERHGVREYWLVHPTDRLVMVRRRGEDGTYGKPEITEGKGELAVGILPGLRIDLDAVFAGLHQTT